jgi:hypothetical protein
LRTPALPRPPHPIPPVSLPILEHRPKFHCRLFSPPPATLGIAVGSRHQASLAPINPRASFLIPCSCSSTPCCPPIAAGAPSPTSAGVAAFGLTVGSSLRAFPGHHNSLASTTSMP